MTDRVIDVAADETLEPAVEHLEEREEPLPPRDEREDFALCYPDVRWEEVPDPVKEDARLQGVSVAAAYGVYLQRREEIRKAAENALHRAVSQSPGFPRGAVGERLYSLREMQEMSSREVRGRYKTLLASLRRGFEKW